MRTADLKGAALDWAVAQCEGISVRNGFDDDCPEYSTAWAQGGPIIEREMVTLEWTGEDWMGYIWHDEEFFAPTPLVAAMRCYVASKLGNAVDIPDELNQGETA